MIIYPSTNYISIGEILTSDYVTYWVVLPQNIVAPIQPTLVTPDLVNIKFLSSGLHLIGTKKSILDNIILDTTNVQNIIISVSDLKNIIVSEAQLKTIGINTSDLKNIIVSEAQLKTIGINTSDLKNIQINASKMRKGG